MSLDSLLFRYNCNKADTKRDAGLTIPEDVTYQRAICYGPNRKYQTLDVCYPKEVADTKALLPVIVSFHGGAYVYGSTRVYQFYCAQLAQKGFCVVNFNYRLAPKVKFPTPLYDLDLVLQWLTSHAKEYHADLNNVFMVGDSAGAQMACQYGVIYSNAEYRKLFGLQKPALTLRALGLNCGMYDIKHFLTEEEMTLVRKDYFTGNWQQFGEQVEVCKYLTKDFPPSYVLSAVGDKLMVHRVAPFVELLKERGVDCASKIYGDEKTGHVFHVNVRDEIGQQANEDEVAFFRKYLIGSV